MRFLIMFMLLTVVIGSVVGTYAYEKLQLQIEEVDAKYSGVYDVE